MEDQPVQHLNLAIDPVIKSHLKQTARWTRFLAIASVVCLALLFFAAICFSLLSVVSSRFPRSLRQYDRVNRTGFVIFFCCFFALTTISTYYLFRFSSQISRALYGEDQAALENGFGGLKRYLLMAAITGVIFLLFNLFKNFV